MNHGKRKGKPRIDEAVRRELGKMLLNYPRESILSKITITAVDVSPDLAIAKVFFVVFEDKDQTLAHQALEHEGHIMRKYLANTLNLRLTPKLNFIYDKSLERSRALLALIDRAVK